MLDPNTKPRSRRGVWVLLIVAVLGFGLYAAVEYTWLQDSWSTGGQSVLALAQPSLSRLRALRNRLSAEVSALDGMLKAEQNEEARDAEVSKQGDETLARIYVGYLSGAKNFDRRRAIRERCDFGADAKPVFFVAKPSTPDPHPEAHGWFNATKDEQDVERKLIGESAQFGDIHVVPQRDYYRDTTGKVIALFETALTQSKAELIVKMDDDTCIDLKRAWALYKRAEGRELFGGACLYLGNSHPAMTAANGRAEPFYAGPTYMTSRALAEVIFVKNQAHTALFAPYGTSCEDANMGRWVVQAKRTNPEMNIAWLTDDQMSTHAENGRVWEWNQRACQNAQMDQVRKAYNMTI